MKNKREQIFSGGYFAENLKRAWPLAAMFFVFYFLSGPFIIFKNRGVLSNVTVSNVFAANNFAFLVFAVVMPLAVTLMLFQYLHKNNSVNTLGSMPMTRTSMFVTNYVSGLVLMLIPLVLTTILFAVLKRPVIISAYDFVGNEVLHNMSSDVYTFKLIFGWLRDNFVNIFFTYSVCVLAACISGTLVMQFLNCIALNLLPIAIYLCGYYFTASYTFGFSMSSDGVAATFRYMHPVAGSLSRIFGNGGLTYSAPWTFYYLGIALLVSVLAYIAYKKRPAERAGESYVLKSAKWGMLIVQVIVYTTLLSLIIAAFTVENVSDVPSLANIAIAFVIAFVISLMIVRKSFSIFNKEIVKPLIVSLVIMTAFVCCFKFDLCGVERRVPKSSSVESASVDVSGYLSNLQFKEQENIDNVIAFHKEVISDRKMLEDYPNVLFDSESSSEQLAPYGGDQAGLSCYVNIDYKLKGGRSLTRNYEMPLNYVSKSDELRNAFSSEDARSGIKYISNSNSDSWDGNISVYSEEFEEGERSYNLIGMPSDLKSALKDAIAADCENVSYDDILKYARSNVATCGYIDFHWEENGEYESRVSNRVESCPLGQLLRFPYSKSYDSQESKVVTYEYRTEVYPQLMPETQKVLERIAKELPPDNIE